MSYKFAWISCEKRDRDWNAAQILDHGVSFFITTGDTPYCNQGPFTDVWGSSTNPVSYNSLEADFLTHYTQSQANPAWQAIRAGTRCYHIWDDWEFGFNSFDWDRAGINASFPVGDSRTQFSTQAEVNALGIEARKAYVSARSLYFDNPPAKNPDGTTPSGEVPSGALQESQNPSATDFPPLYSYELLNSQGGVVTSNPADIVIYLDCMHHCSPNTDTDDASKTRLGSVQKAWLFNLFDTFNNQVNFFHLVSTKKTRSASGDNADTWDGYSTELIEILDYIKDNGITTVVWFAGDSHQPSVNTADTLGAYEHYCFNSSPIGGVLNGADENTDNFWVSTAINHPSSQQGNTYGLAEVKGGLLTVTYYRREDNTPTMRATFRAGSNAVESFEDLEAPVAPTDYMEGEASFGNKDRSVAPLTEALAKGGSVTTSVFSVPQSGRYNAFYVNASPNGGPNYDRAYVTVSLKQGGQSLRSARIQLPSYNESSAQDVFYLSFPAISLVEGEQYALEVAAEEADILIGKDPDYLVWVESEEQAMPYFGMPDSTTATVLAITDTEWTGCANTNGNTDENWSGTQGAEVGLKFPVVTEDIRLTNLKFRGSCTADTEVTFRVYDSTESGTGATAQVRPTAASSHLAEFVVSVSNSSGVVQDYDIAINEVLSVAGSLRPQVVAYRSGAQTFNMANDTALFASAPETLTATRSTDGLTAQAWGNAGSGKAHIMQVVYSAASNGPLSTANAAGLVVGKS